jgi:DNA-binding IclR family transcriptional regulator
MGPGRTAVGSLRGVDAVERALSVLACFEVAGETLTLAQVAQRSRLYKSTILRLAISLQRTGFLKRDENGRFSLGEKLRQLSELARVSDELESAIPPEVKQLAAATGETTSFYVRQQRHRVLLFRDESPNSERHHLIEGGRHPLFVGATGRIFKAFGETPKDDESTDIRRRGWVTSRGERKPDLGAVAVPILNARHELLGVLNITLPLPRFTKVHERNIRSHLIESRHRIQARIAHMDVASIVHGY